ncbi:MAG: hypothetical protein ACPW60_15370 [Methylohalobius sp. ZOD2]|nr:hypothetical protein [Methylothermaceae bacterium]
MEDEKSNESLEPSQGKEPREPPLRKMTVWLDESVLIVLLLLSLAGIVISAYSSQGGYFFWLIMIPIFWLGAVLSSRAQARRTGESDVSIKTLLWFETLHWGGVLLAVIGVFVLRHMEIVDDVTAVLDILLVIALGTYLNGIRIGWRFSLIGVFLGTTAMLIAYVEQFLPLAVLIAITFIVLSLYWGKRKIRRHPPHDIHHAS